MEIDKVTHSANLLVCLGGLATATGILTGAGAAIAGAMSLRELTRRLPPEVKPLAEETTNRLRKRLTAPGISDDQRILIPDMIMASLPDPDEIADQGLQSDRLVAAMADSLSDTEHRLPDNIALFKSTLTPIFTDLLDDRAFTETLAPAIHRTVLGRLTEIADNVADLSTKYGTLARTLDHLEE